MDHPLTYLAVGAADTDVLIGTAKAALDMSLEMGQGEQRIILEHVLAYGHMIEPLAAFYRQISRTVFISDIDRAESPAVDFQCLTVLLGRIAVTDIVGVRLDDRCIFQCLTGLNDFLDPGSRSKVRAVLFAGMELYCYLAADIAVNFFICFLYSLRRDVSGEIYDRFVALSVFIRNIDVAVCCRLDF